MKKTFIIGFILLGVVAKGEMGRDVRQNQIILDNIKLENIQLREEVDRLSKVLNKLEANLVKEIKFEELGVEIRRDINSFTLKMVSNELSQGKYNKLLDSFIEISKYSSEDTIIFYGNQENTSFLSSYFASKEFDPSRITVEINTDSNIDKLNHVETKITLRKKEN